MQLSWVSKYKQLKSVQKIESLFLETYNIVITIFQILHKLGYLWFFKKMFLFAKISRKVILGHIFFNY